MDYSCQVITMNVTLTVLETAPRSERRGRKEPGTGEINYRKVFRYIHSRGFDGVIGMEHGNSVKGADGESKVIAAYVDADRF